MPLKSFTRIDGLTGLVARAVLDALNALVDAVNAASKDRPVSALVTGSYTARYDDIARVQAGGSLSLPAANASSASKRVGLIVIGSGLVRVTAQAATLPGGSRQGTVSGATFELALGPGFVEYVSDGSGGWSSTSSASSGAASVAAAAVVPTWANVLKAGPHSGAFSAFVDTGRFINFGLPGPTASSPQIRSGDAAFRIRGAGNISVGAVTSSTLFATGAAALVQISSDAGPVSVDGFQGVTITTGALVPRLAFDATGAWAVSNVAGATGQLITSQGPGTPVLWADPAGSTSTVNIAPTGAQGIISIASVKHGGSLTLQPTGAFNIDGFSVKPDGFWFDLMYRDAGTAFAGTLNQDVGSTTTSIFNPGATALVFNTLDSLRIRYQNNRWRVIQWRQSTGGGSVPTGTGFTHITAGIQDGAAKLVDTADINASQVTNAKLANMAANTVKVEATGVAAAPQDLVVAANTVLGRAGANVVAAALVNAQIAANTITHASEAQPAANTVAGNWTAGAANMADNAVGANTVVGRVAGNIVAAQLVGAQVAAATLPLTTLATQAAKSAVVNATNGAASPTALAASAARQRLRANDAFTALEWAMPADGVKTAATVVSAATTALACTNTYTPPANALVVGSRFRIIYTYQFVRGATVTALNLTSTFNIGAVNINVAHAASVAASFTGQVRVEGEFTVLTTGAGGTCMATMTVTSTAGATASGNIVAAANIALACNTTLALAISGTAAMSVGVAATTITATGGHIEWIN